MVKDKTKEHIEWLENTINETYGSKCPDYVKECWCCKAWEFFYEIKNYCLPTCDWKGKCKNKAFREIYHKKWWSYLCKKHFLQEQRTFKKKGRKLARSGLRDFEKVRN